MRNETRREVIERFMVSLGEAVTGSGKLYFNGGVCAVLMGWRENTVDIDLAAAPEPLGFFEALPAVKDRLNVNVELAAPSDFIPALPGWQDRSIFLRRQGKLDFFHYDFYSQALAKIERWHARDQNDVGRMIGDGLVNTGRMWEMFQTIQPQLIRYPAIDGESFETRLKEIVETFAR